MPTVLLEACRIAHRIFTLARPAARVSIRDSMWRSQSFCERVIGELGLGSASQALIIGGGPSALVCAMTLSSHGVCPTIVEHGKVLAGRQAACLQRGICPTTFDFPYTHWSMGHYPVLANRAILPWERELAGNVHRSWMDMFEDHFERSQTPIRIMLEASVTDWPAVPLNQMASSRLKVAVSGKEAGKPQNQTSTLDEHFDLVIFCTGVGTEIRALTKPEQGEFQSYAFWDKYDPAFPSRWET